jgi:hypothetical protein
MSELDDDAIDAYAEAVAAQLTEDSTKRILITEAIRNASRRSPPQHHYSIGYRLGEVDLFDFTILKERMVRCTFNADGTCTVVSFGVQLEMGTEVSLRFCKYLEATIPDVMEDIRRAHEKRLQLPTIPEKSADSQT